MGKSAVAVVLLCLAGPAIAASVLPDLTQMSRLADGKTRMVNALWIENPKETQMGEGRNQVLVADLKGPGIITMIHFALPASMTLNRNVLLRIFWDGETNPSVDCPLVDFFADPNGAMDRVNSVLVNKRRGWNAYFPMPFAKSARVEISHDDPRYAASWERCPCYSYVLYREVKKIPKKSAYFHAAWRQETLLLGKHDYEVFNAKGPGQFVGWNMTIRSAANPEAGYPVDENERFFIDGEQEPSIEWQGLEDSFGFSWGFPESANEFPLTGYQPYYKTGAAAFRFCISDCISFSKSIKMTVGFGKNENQMFHEEFSKPQNPLQLSSVAYWYQKEPHTPYAAIPPASDRHPVFQGAAKMKGDPQEYQARNISLALTCGAKDGDILYLKDGWDFVMKTGFPYSGFPGEINHCWASDKALKFDVRCPKNARGKLKLYIVDGDNFQGGRKESVSVAGRDL